MTACGWQLVEQLLCVDSLNQIRVMMILILVRVRS